MVVPDNVVRYNRIKINPGDRGAVIQELEQYLKQLGWKNLKWGFGGPPEDVEVRKILRGCPPNYNGSYSDYDEDMAMTLQDGNCNYKDEILVRQRLNGPYFAEQTEDLLKVA